LSESRSRQSLRLHEGIDEVQQNSSILILDDNEVGQSYRPLIADEQSSVAARETQLETYQRQSRQVVQHESETDTFFVEASGLHTPIVRVKNESAKKITEERAKNLNEEGKYEYRPRGNTYEENLQVSEARQDPNFMRVRQSDSTYINAASRRPSDVIDDPQFKEAIRKARRVSGHKRDFQSAEISEEERSVMDEKQDVSCLRQGSLSMRQELHESEKPTPDDVNDCVQIHHHKLAGERSRGVVNQQNTTLGYDDSQSRKIQGAATDKESIGTKRTD